MLNQRRLAPVEMTATAVEHELELVDLLYTAARDASAWPDALFQLAVQMGAESAMIVTWDAKRAISSAVTSAGPLPPGDASGAITIRHIAEQIMQRSGSAGGFEDGDARLGPFFAVDAGAVGHGSPCLLVLPSPKLCGAGRAGWISIALDARQTAWGEEAYHRISAMRGHLLRALDLSFDLAELRHAARSTDTLLGALPTAALMLGPKACILRANAAARAILKSQDGVFEAPDRRLRARLAREDQNLAHAIEVSLAAGRSEHSSGFRHAVRIRREGSAAPLLIVLDPVPLQASSSFLDAPQPAVLARIVSDEHMSEGVTYPLQAGFDLTPAEMRIAAAIASGRSPAMAARHLDLSTNTVRSHLGRIFDKTGTRSQHALTRLLAAIGSWPLS